MIHSLQLFAARALRQLPVALWWVLGLFVGAICSIQLEKELFPNTPTAIRVAQVLWKLCVVALPLLTTVWLWRVALMVEHSAWRLLWALAVGGAALATGLLLLLLLFVLLP